MHGASRTPSSRYSLLPLSGSYFSHIVPSQLVLPPTRPDATSLTDPFHFRLPLSIREVSVPYLPPSNRYSRLRLRCHYATTQEISAHPPVYQTITKNDEGPLRTDDQEQPLPPGAPRMCLPIHSPGIPHQEICLVISRHLPSSPPLC